MKIKSITLVFLLALSILKSYSQTIDYPRYEIDSLGQTVVVLTVEQAVQLDNNSELLLLFEKLNVQLGEYDSACVKVINSKEEVIAIQKMEISTLKQSLANKDAQIVTLQNRIAEYVVRVGILEEQVANRQDVISEKDLQIRNLKTKMLIGGAGSGIIIVGLILGLLLIN